MFAAAACGKQDASQEVAANAPAGTVTEVAGQVTVAGKPLAVGATVNAEDEISTGADGRFAVVLAHNHATWQLGPNHKGKARDSIAWGMAIVQGSAAANSAVATSAGRNGERAAADTDVTAAAPAAQAPAAAAVAQDEAAPAPGAPAPPPPPPAPAAAKAPSTGALRRAAPPDDMKESEAAPRNVRGVDPAAEHAKSTLRTNAKVRACLAHAASATLVVTCASGTCSLISVDPAAGETCLRDAIPKLGLPAGDYTVTVEIKAPAR